jgi:choline dehydrogenase-like flavoprotein
MGPLFQPAQIRQLRKKRKNCESRYFASLEDAGSLRRARISYSIVAASVKVLQETPGLSAGAWQMRPLSRGYVEAKSNQPGDMPAINPRYPGREPARHSGAD